MPFVDIDAFRIQCQWSCTKLRPPLEEKHKRVFCFFRNLQTSFASNSCTNNITSAHNLYWRSIRNGSNSIPDVGEAQFSILVTRYQHCLYAQSIHSYLLIFTHADVTKFSRAIFNKLHTSRVLFNRFPIRLTGKGVVWVGGGGPSYTQYSISCSSSSTIIVLA